MQLWGFDLASSFYYVMWHRLQLRLVSSKHHQIYCPATMTWWTTTSSTSFSSFVFGLLKESSNFVVWKLFSLDYLLHANYRGLFLGSDLFKESSKLLSGFYGSVDYFLLGQCLGLFLISGA